jgi:hypothetical protein
MAMGEVFNNIVAIISYLNEIARMRSTVRVEFVIG